MLPVDHPQPTGPRTGEGFDQIGTHCPRTADGDWQHAQAAHQFGARSRRLIEAWRVDYNTYRPHSALGGISPMEFLQQGDAVRTPLSSNRHHPVR